MKQAMYPLLAILICLALAGCANPTSTTPAAAAATTPTATALSTDLSKITYTITATNGNGAVSTLDTTDKTPPAVKNTIPSSTLATNSYNGASPLVIYLNDSIYTPSLSGNFTCTATISSVKYYSSGTLTISKYSGSEGGAIINFSATSPFPKDSVVNFTITKKVQDKGGNNLPSDISITFTSTGGASTAFSDTGFENSATADLTTAQGDVGIATSAQTTVGAGTKCLALSTGYNITSKNAIDYKYSIVTLGPFNSAPSSLTLKYNFLSEEFNEYVNTQYDDNATITITGPNGTVTETIGSVNLFGAQTTATTDFTLSGAYMTGWKSYTKSGLNVGSPVYVTLTISDIGDTALTSVLLVDDIGIK